MKRLRRPIDYLHSSGYNVHLHLNEVSIENSKARAISRFNATGRFVDTQYIDSIGLKPTEKYDTLKTYVNGYSKINNDVAKGEKPILLQEKASGLPTGSNIFARQKNDSGTVQRVHEVKPLEGNGGKLDKTVHKNLFTQDEINNLNRNSHFNVNWNEDYNNTISNIKEI